MTVPRTGGRTVMTGAVAAASRVCTARKLESGAELGIQPTYFDVEMSVSTIGLNAHPTAHIKIIDVIAELLSFLHRQ